MIGTVALAPLMLLTACSGSTENDAQDVRDAILAEAPGVEDAVVRYRTDIFTNKLSIRLSMPTVSEGDDAALLAAIDAALDQAWNASPSEPSNISIEIAPAPFAEGERIGDPGTITLNGRGFDEALGLDYDVPWDTLIAPSALLTERYGQRADA
ncbi:hypothetical protein ACFVQ3_13345 [Oerskovia sp. NPDC057915]|uniref:hypothetical protein n=1 Tax=Oerskovia sp. NPDC057915 TaxID=3346280 RepID=UPI0036D93C98